MIKHCLFFWAIICVALFSMASRVSARSLPGDAVSLVMIDDGGGIDLLGSVKPGGGYDPGASDLGRVFLASPLKLEALLLTPHTTATMLNVGSLASSRRETYEGVNVALTAKYGFAKGSFAMGKVFTKTEQGTQLSWRLRYFQISDYRSIKDRPEFADAGVERLWLSDVNRFMRTYGMYYVDRVYYGHALNVDLEFSSRAVSDYASFNRLVKAAYDNAVARVSLTAGMSEFDRALVNSISFTVKINMVGGETKSLPVALQDLKAGPMENLAGVLSACEKAMRSFESENAIPLAFTYKSYDTVKSGIGNPLLSSTMTKYRDAIEVLYFHRLRLTELEKAVQSRIDSVSDGDTRALPYRVVLVNLGAQKKAIDAAGMQLASDASTLLVNEKAEQVQAKVEAFQKLIKSADALREPLINDPELVAVYEAVFGKNAVLNGKIDFSQVASDKVVKIKRNKGEVPRRMLVIVRGIEHRDWTPNKIYSDGKGGEIKEYWGRGRWTVNVRIGTKTIDLSGHNTIDKVYESPAKSSPNYPQGLIPIYVGGGKVISDVIGGYRDEDTITVSVIPKPEGTTMAPNNLPCELKIMPKTIVQQIDSIDSDSINEVLFYTDERELIPDSRFGANRMAYVRFAFEFLPLD